MCMYILSIVVWFPFFFDDDTNCRRRQKKMKKKVMTEEKESDDAQLRFDDERIFSSKVGFAVIEIK